MSKHIFMYGHVTQTFENDPFLFRSHHTRGHRPVCKSAKGKTTSWIFFVLQNFNCIFCFNFTDVRPKFFNFEIISEKVEICFKEELNVFKDPKKFWLEIEVGNRNFGQQSKCWSKIQILVKYRNF